MFLVILGENYRKMKIYIGIILAFLLISCGGTKAYFDYDQEVDFSKFNTYGFYADMESGLSELDQDRMIAALDTVLQENNFNKSETPDFKINIFAEPFNKASNSSIGIGLGGGGGAVGGGVSGGIPVGGDQLFLSITIDFADAVTNELFWQAVVESRFNENWSPQERSEFFREIAEKALENYPPEED